MANTIVPSQLMNAARVLFVDDDEALRILVHRQLSSEGFNVTIATNGDDAMQALMAEMFDLVILDIRMPGMDGLAVLAEMRRRSIKPRVIVLTGVDDLGVVINTARLGANDYITKPFEIEQLLESIRRVLQV